MDINKKVLAIGVEAGKLTAEKLKEIISSFLLQKEAGKLVTETTNYKDFNNPGGVSLINLTPDKKELALFDNMASENDMNYSLKLNSQTNKLYLCLQGTNQEKIIAFMKEYVKKYEEQKARYQSHEKATEKSKETAKSDVAQKSVEKHSLPSKEKGLEL